MDTNMKPDELRDFEKEEVHHSAETEPEAGPASEADINREQKPRPTSVLVPPNAD